MSEVNLQSVFNMNRFFVSAVERLAGDIPEEKMLSRPGETPDQGNSPLWILGHLAICVEFAEALLGDEMQNPRWVPVFGPGSPGDIKKPERYSHEAFLKKITEDYFALHDRIVAADPDQLNEPHGLDLFSGTSFKTRRDVLLHLMTTHIAFHSAQLSRCRKVFGHERLL